MGTVASADSAASARVSVPAGASAVDDRASRCSSRGGVCAVSPHLWSGREQFEFVGRFAVFAGGADGGWFLG